MLGMLMKLILAGRRTQQIRRDVQAFNPHQQSVFQRLELKYKIDERTAARIREDIAPYCLPDRFNTVQNGRGYPLKSLYFDTPSLEFHRAKLRGDNDRFKLRARSYGEKGPVHLEVKRKIGEVVHKTRVAVPREGWEASARGHEAPLEDHPSQRMLLDRFVSALLRTAAEPQLNVSYDREAYFGVADNYARVTFDRHICVQKNCHWSFDDNGSGWTYIDAERGRNLNSFIMLELKCEPLMPAWMSELIYTHQLERRGYSKYSVGITAMRDQELGIDPWQQETVDA